MKYNILGKSGIEVSQLCFGTLPSGPLQANQTVDKAAAVIKHALEQGVSFIDTAQRYQTYEHIRAALAGCTQPVVIASKSMATTYGEMRQAIDAARDGPKPGYY